MTTDHDGLDPKAIVRAGYDAASYAYRGDAERPVKYETWLSDLAQRTKPRGRILDLGCGNGIPAAQWLSDHGFEVVGIDISPVQVERANRLVPNATFMTGDMTELDLPPASFDGVVSLYAVIHVPVQEQVRLFHSVRRWLRPGTPFLVLVGTEEWTGTEEDWLGSGTVMYWSHAATDDYRTWLKGAGFSIAWERFVPEGEGGHTLMMAVAAQDRGKPG